MNSTDICNMALAYIGQGRIASIEEESEEAIQCSMFYDHLRRKLLSEHRWGFAEVHLCLPGKMPCHPKNLRKRKRKRNRKRRLLHFNRERLNKSNLHRHKKCLCKLYRRRGERGTVH